MDPSSKVQLHECCAVAYRNGPAGIEFCLVTPISENRWEFPKVALDQRQPHLIAVAQAAERAGLNGCVKANEPLGQFVASRGGEARSMMGYLMHVSSALDNWPEESSVRRLWCLAEEARVRIRRKPLRRFIDLALHSIVNQSVDVHGNHGHASELTTSAVSFS